MGSSIWSKIIISDEEYERRKAQNNKVKVKSSNTLVSESTINGIKKAINYFDSLFITEEEYQKRKKEKKERKAYQKAEAKKKAYETAEIEKFTENWVKTMAYKKVKSKRWLRSTCGKTQVCGQCLLVCPHLPVQSPVPVPRSVGQRAPDGRSWLLAGGPRRPSPPPTARWTAQRPPPPPASCPTSSLRLGPARGRPELLRRLPGLVDH